MLLPDEQARNQELVASAAFAQFGIPPYQTRWLPQSMRQPQSWCCPSSSPPTSRGCWWR